MNVNPANVLVGGGAAAGASAEVDVMIDNKNAFEYFNIVGNTNIGPKLDGSFGLNLAADATATHGVEYDTGITPQNPFTFTIDNTGATTPAFFLKGIFKIATVAGATGCTLAMGFRKLAARNATMSNYTDFATIGTLAGEYKTVTNLAAAGTITTDTTVATVNAAIFEIAVFVDAFGNVTYQLNGATPPVVVPYQFANGLVVMPFLRVTQAASTTATASCNYFECGFQS
jgi:hypothetical protein